jgi:predicted TIM-barrel fold metal-dependent hydrolase
MHRYLVSSPPALAVLEEVAAARGVAYVQCGLLQVKVRDLLGLPRTTDLTFANPLSLVPAADAFPRVPFVIPHLGAGFLRETLMAGSQCANVHVDTSSSNGWLATQAPPLDLTGALRSALRVFGPDRILFGTDSSTFPRGWRADVLRAQEDALAAIGVAPADRAKLLGANAARLLEQAGGSGPTAAPSSPA